MAKRNATPYQARIVALRRMTAPWDLPYRSGRVKHWIKIKNPNGPAMQRAKDGTF